MLILTNENKLNHFSIIFHFLIGDILSQLNLVVKLTQEEYTGSCIFNAFQVFLIQNSVS